MRAVSRVGDRRVDSKRYAELIGTLAARTLKVRYRGSALGVFWSLSNPLLMTGIYTLIFGTAFARYYGNSIPAYTISVFVGLAILAFFTSATTQALQSVVSAGPLLNKIAIPFSVFPLSFVAANVFQLAVGVAPLLLLVTIFRTHSAVHASLLLAPLIGLVLVSTGFGLLTSALYVFFRDLPYLYELFSFVLYMTSPIFYPASIVPPSVRSWLALNPLADIVEVTRRIALNDVPVTLHTVVSPLLVGGVSVAIGALVFGSLRFDFMDLL